MMLSKGDFIICTYYTNINYIAKILSFPSEYTVALELCCESFSKRTYDTEIIEIERTRISPLDISLAI